MGSHRILLAAGSNSRGQLGISSNDDAHTFTPCQFAECEPSQLPDLTTITNIACGANHTILLLQHPDDSTTLWGTGDGRQGQLGSGYPREVQWTVFRKLILPPCLAAAPGESYASYTSCGYTYKHIAATWEATYVVLSCPGRSDVLLSMGSNEFGALGVGNSVDATQGSVGIVDLDYVFSDVAERRAQPGTVCVRSLHASPRHVVAQLVASNGSASCSRTALVGWGASRHGQLGRNGGLRCVARPMRLPINVHDDPMVACALGNQHTVVLHESGRISAFGSNKQGQMPSLELRKRICGLGCTWNGTYMQTIDGDLLSTGNNAQGQLGRGYIGEPAPAVDTNVSLPIDRVMSRFVCGSEHVLAAMTGSPQEGSSVVGWGWNEHGNMGLESLDNITIPTQLWPRDDIKAYGKHPQRVIDIWAGCATSWLLVE